jgi:hypothetical protein
MCLLQRVLGALGWARRQQLVSRLRDERPDVWHGQGEMRSAAQHFGRKILMKETQACMWIVWGTMQCGFRSWSVKLLSAVKDCSIFAQNPKVSSSSTSCASWLRFYWSVRRHMFTRHFQLFVLWRSGKSLKANDCCSGRSVMTFSNFKKWSSQNRMKLEH